MNDEETIEVGDVYVTPGKEILVVVDASPRAIVLQPDGTFYVSWTNLRVTWDAYRRMEA